MIGSNHICHWNNRRVSFRNWLLLTFIILNPILTCLLLLSCLLHLLLSRNWTWRSQFASILWSTARPSFLYLLWLFLRCHMRNLMWASIERLVNSTVHRTHSCVLSILTTSRLLLTLSSINSIWPDMAAAARSVHNLDWPISEGGKNRFRINICLCLSLLHLSRLWPSLCHVRQAIRVAYNHAVVVWQHVRMIYVCLIILVVLVVTEHLCRSVLHSLWSDAYFLTCVHFTGTWSLRLINLKMRTTSSSWLMDTALNWSISHHSRIDRSNMAMALLLLLWSWSWSTVYRIWIWTGLFFLTPSNLTRMSVIWTTLSIFVISCGLRSASTHWQILLFLKTALVTGNISRLRLTLILF